MATSRWYARDERDDRDRVGHPRRQHVCVRQPHGPLRGPARAPGVGSHRPRRAGDLEYVETTQAVRDGLARLVEQGFWIAVDDFAVQAATCTVARPGADREIRLLCRRGAKTSRKRIEIDHAAGRLVVVERIETPADHREAEVAGADYFQGFFARPAVLTARAAPSNKLHADQLLAHVNDPESRSRTSSTSWRPTSLCR